VLSLVIAAVEHEVGALRCFKLGVGTVLSDQQVSGAPGIEIRNPSPRPIGAPYHAIMATLDLTDDKKLALVAHLRHALEYDPFPYPPRLDPLNAILAKLEPSVPRPEPLPPIKAGRRRGLVAGDAGGRQDNSCPAA